jgi:hypothetical protein
MNVAPQLVVIACASCGGGNHAAVPTGTAKVEVPSTATCHDAYAEYETRWRLARTEEIAELVAGDTDVLEEILYYELASLPSRVELGKLRVIYAIVDVFLWNAPWPQALTAVEAAIERCGEQTARPAV